MMTRAREEMPVHRPSWSRDPGNRSLDAGETYLSSTPFLARISITPASVEEEIRQRTRLLLDQCVGQSGRCAGLEFDRDAGLLLERFDDRLDRHLLAPGIDDQFLGSLGALHVRPEAGDQ